VQAFLLSRYPEYQDWLARPVVGLVAIAAAVLFGAHLASGGAPGQGWLDGVTHGAAAAGVGALLVVPTLWSGMSVVDGASRGPLPLAGPAPARGPFGDGNGPGPQVPNGPFNGAGPRAPGGFGGGQRNGRDDGGFGPGGNVGPPPGFEGVGNQAALIQFLQAHRDGASFLVATGSANQAAPIILATGEPVMALGGFSGGDPILTPSDLAARVRAGDVRYFLLGGGPGGQGRNGTSAWVQLEVPARCTTAR
jgi:4-amino-4-deoxy-L-arabinose transferase-like glycosyltransferase